MSKGRLVWDHEMTDANGKPVRFAAFDTGHVAVAVPTKSALLDPQRQDEFARAYTEACRRASGEPAAMAGAPEADCGCGFGPERCKAYEDGDYRA